MNLRGRRTVFAAASLSLLVPAGKGSIVEISGHHAVAASLPLGGSAATATPEEETEIDAGIGGCSWRASDAPPIAPSATVATGWVEGF